MTRFAWQDGAAEQDHSARWLRRRFLTALLLVSVVPFVLLSGGAWLVFRNLAIERTLTLHQAMLRAHAAAIDRYLDEQVRTLETLARTVPLAELSTQEGLRRVFAVLADVHGGFVDLGVIDAAGRHLAYVGPYDLLDRRYDQTGWFRTVAARGVIVSDVFLGFRQVPHSVVAVRREDGAGWWILRATLDSRRLDDLVRALEVGRHGDVFVVNRAGQYQTTPRTGAVLDVAQIPEADLQPGLRDRRVRRPEGTLRQVTASLNGGEWVLVVQQPEREILAPVTRAVALGGGIAAAAVALVALTVVLLTTHLTRRVEQADQQRDRMYADLLRSARLASLGEMATGLAHEINNPLATITAEQTNLGDLVSEVPLPPDARAGFERSIERCRRQVARCAAITAKMLQFGRVTATEPRAADLEPVLRDLAPLLERRTRARNITLTLAIPSGLPRAWFDAGELEQVVVNLVNNAVDAMPRGGTITVAAAPAGDHVLLTVRDEGCGIPPEHLESVFQPFFTTKPPGEGTGLGLAVVYGIVRGWGGTITADSAPGQGTTMAVRLPVADAAHEGDRDHHDAPSATPAAAGR